MVNVTVDFEGDSDGAMRQMIDFSECVPVTHVTCHTTAEFCFTDQLSADCFIEHLPDGVTSRPMRDDILHRLRE